MNSTSGVQEEPRVVEESTPLLSAEREHERVYERFTPARKRTLVAFASWAGFVPFLVTGSLLPALPKIVQDLKSSPSVIGLAVSVPIFAVAVGNLVWATYSGFYGRRSVYLVSLPTLCIGSLGVASAQSVPAFLFWRIVQAFGASSGMSVGAAVIGDIYKLEERGSAMGIFFGASLLGPAIAPTFGGAATHYASWRIMQIVIASAAALAVLLIYAYFPETTHPGTRGVDKRALEKGGPVGWVWLNPFASLWLLRSPNLLCVTLAGTTALLTDFVLCLPIAYTIGRAYNIQNEAIIGFFFIPVGLGNIVAAPLGGRISDAVVIYYRKKRGGIWVPEDRLRVALLPALTLVPLSVLLCGLTTRYIPGSTGIAINVVLLFMNGIGVDLVLGPSAAYGVDVLHSRSAEIMAASSGLRASVIAIISAGVLPSMEKIGFVATDAIAAGLGWLGFVLLFLTVRYGDRMRAWVDIGYSTVVDN